MSLSYPKLVRGLYLLLFSISGIFSFIKSNNQACVISALCLIGFIAFDIVCYFRDLKKQEDNRFSELDESIKKVAGDLSEIKNDHSLAHLAATFKRK